MKCLILLTLQSWFNHRNQMYKQASEKEDTFTPVLLQFTLCRPKVSAFVMQNGNGGDIGC